MNNKKTDGNYPKWKYTIPVILIGLGLLLLFVPGSPGTAADTLVTRQISGLFSLVIGLVGVIVTFFTKDKSASIAKILVKSAVTVLIIFVVLTLLIIAY